MYCETAHALLVPLATPLATQTPTSGYWVPGRYIAVATRLTTHVPLAGRLPAMSAAAAFALELM